MSCGWRTDGRTATEAQPTVTNEKEARLTVANEKEAQPTVTNEKEAQFTVTNEKGAQSVWLPAVWSECEGGALRGSVQL